MNENQHWIPKFLIKNFTDSDGRVFCLDIQTSKITKPPPKHAASDTGFNEFIIDGEFISFEQKFEKIETKAAPILKTIAIKQSVAELTKNQRHKLADFIAIQSFRTEAFYKGLKTDIAKEQWGHIFSQLWDSVFILASEIERRKWVVMTIDHDDVFYLGDNPIVLQNTECPMDGSELGFDINGIEAYMPLSPKSALYMPCTTTSQKIISRYDNAVQTHKNIRSLTFIAMAMPSITSSFLRQSQQVMLTSNALYNSMKTGVPFPVSSENIQNLNSLQCLFAHRAIYSNQRDFTFAKHVFSETPQYQETPNTKWEIFGSPPRK